ncbi:MAG: hypothetical protein ABSG45_01325 [Nitrososphaerales archaeon]
MSARPWAQMVSNTKRIALGSLFGVLILVFIGFVPAPSDDFLIGIQAFLLAISFLVVGRGGATYVGIVSGMLITLAKPQFFPLDLIFAVSYGVMVDGLSRAFRVKEGPSARKWRLVGVMTISTAVVGFVAYYVSAVMTNLVPNELLLDVTVLVFGVVSGAIGGYAAALVWNRYLKSRI